MLFLCVILKTMTLPKSLTTVTTLSKVLAGILFVALPFLGFYGGMRYQTSVTPAQLPPEKACASCQTQKNISPTPMPTPMPTQSKQDVLLPVVVYEPSGLFNDKDKEELNKKVTGPFFDYNNEKEMIFIAIIINKDVSAKYSYMAINKNGGYESSVLTKKNDQFDYWVPGCMGPCEFSQSFKDKYPEIVKLANP